MNEPKVVRAYRFRRRAYTITQNLAEGPVVEVVESTSAIRALRRVDLVPGAKVCVLVPVVTHVRRTLPGL